MMTDDCMDCGVCRCTEGSKGRDRLMEHGIK